MVTGAALPQWTTDLQALGAAKGIGATQYLGFNPSGEYQPYNASTGTYAKSRQGPYATYGLGNDPYELLADQYHSTQLLDPQANPYAGEAAVRAQQLASGATGDKLGAATQGAIGDQSAAAYGIQAAGGQNQAAQNRQFGQTGQDLNVVRASALGTGPSAAENLARSQLDSNIRAQASLASSARGGNIASAMRGAQGAGSSMMLQSQAQMAAQRAQEQLNAQQLLTQGNNALSGQIGQARATDIGQATATAGALDRTAANQQNLMGTRAGLSIAGQNALGVSADRNSSERARFVQARMQAAGAVTGYGLQKYSLDQGIPVNLAGPQANLSIANQEDARLREAAVMNSLSTLGAGISQLGGR